MNDGDQPRATAGHTVAYERSPVDLLRLLIGVGLVAGLVVLLVFAEESMATFVGDVLRGFDAFPQWLIDTVVLAARLLTTVLFVVGLGAAIVHRRFRLLLMVVGTALVASLGYAALHALVDVSGASVVDVGSQPAGVLSNRDFPTGEGVAVIAAVATVSAPWVPRRWRRLAWTLVVATALARQLTAPSSLDTLSALLAGWTAGSLGLVIGGGPVRRPTDEAVAAGLASVGVPVQSIKKASVDARGSTPYFATAEDGESLFVKALGADERSADLLFRAYRKALPYDLGDERSFSSLRRAVEHEALVALTATDLGVRTPAFRAFARVGPDGFVLAYRGIQGSSLDGVPAAAFDDDLLAAVWEQVAILRRHRVAHRDLRLANVFRADDGEVWLIDFGFSELAASDLLLATDLAELLASTSLVVGSARALAAGRAAIGPDALATAAPRLRTFALSGATRSGLKAHPGLLDELRAGVAQP